MPSPPTSAATWEAEQVRERRRREGAQRRRDREWAEEMKSRQRFKDGNELLPRYVALPIDDAAPGTPRFVLVRQD